MIEWLLYDLTKNTLRSEGAMGIFFRFNFFFYFYFHEKVNE